MSDFVVSGRGLGRTFGSGRSAVVAVADATFDVRPGDRIALAGPSGSGKSTLLHLLAALDTPTSGTIEWPALGPADRLRPGPVSFAFQGPSLLPPLSVVENVALPLLLAGVAEDEATAAASEMLERLDLTPLAEKLPEEISGGQAQRAGVARALVGRPRLVLADEPTGQQDRDGGRRVLEAMVASANASGATLVVATHDRAVAERFPIGWSMEDGRLETEVTLCST